ncbi:hypothetical protein IWX75_002953 [Arthrobacter sp. CAN_A6]
MAAIRTELRPLPPSAAEELSVMLDVAQSLFALPARARNAPPAAALPR